MLGPFWNLLGLYHTNAHIVIVTVYRDDLKASGKDGILVTAFMNFAGAHYGGRGVPQHQLKFNGAPEGRRRLLHRLHQGLSSPLPFSLACSRISLSLEAHRGGRREREGAPD